MLADTHRRTPLSFSRQWEYIADWRDAQHKRFLIYPVLGALLPAVSWYIGLTQVGWSVGDGEMLRLTTDSAARIIALMYLAMLFCIAVVGYIVHWMSDTYGCDTTFPKGITVTSLTATPLFLFGVLGLYPLFWLDLMVGLLSLSWSIYLLYVGIPIVMRIPPERGFFYASAIVAACLVVFMALMGGSVILWDFGAAPVFTD